MLLLTRYLRNRLPPPIQPQQLGMHILLSGIIHSRLPSSLVYLRLSSTVLRISLPKISTSLLPRLHVLSLLPLLSLLPQKAQIFPIGMILQTLVLSCQLHVVGHQVSVRLPYPPLSQTNKAL
jgi:hypothetical protein